MFEQIITSDEVKFNDLEKKVFKFVCFFGSLTIKLMLEAYDRKLMETRDDPRHSLVNKQYIAGIMKPKEIAKLRDARVFRQYDESKIKLRVTNGDGAKWTKGITVKGGIYQKDQFHIMQEIVRDVPKEYRNIFVELINKKKFDKIQAAIDSLKYEIDGEYQIVKKLNKLQSYLSGDLERYSRSTRGTRMNRI